MIHARSDITARLGIATPNARGFLQEATKHRIRQTGQNDAKIRLAYDFVSFGVVSRAADKTSVATTLFGYVRFVLPLPFISSAASA